MWRVMWWILLFPLSAVGQTLVVPDQVEVGQKIVAECRYDAPEGTKLTILWDTSEGLESEQVGQRFFLWGRSGEYSINAVVIPLKTITVDDQTFDVIAGPIMRLDASFEITGGEPPGPGPGPDPQDAPFPADGYTALILREAKETGLLDEAQKAIFTSREIRDYLKKTCIKLEDGSIAARFWDDDYTQSQLSTVPEVLRTAYSATLEASAGQLPWIAISDGKTGTSQPLPGTVAETLALLKQYGG